MKQPRFATLLPHVIAVVVFLIVAVFVCRPILSPGVGIKQSDVTTYQGMSHQSQVYKETHGHFPLWVNSMFSGMPAFQIAIEGSWSPILQFDRLFKLGLPVPISFFFLACISFYFLGMCLRLKTIPAILGALAFAYCTYSPIIITAGHDTKMLGMAYAPAVIGACILIFNKKYLVGFTLTALLTALQIAQGHQQVSYYLFLILLAMGISYMIQLIKTNQTTHLLKSLGLMVGAGILAVMVNAIILFPTYDYAKESKRGGQLIMDPAAADAAKAANGKTAGLSKAYAFQWSYGIAETMTLMFPGVMGYGNHQAQRDGEVYSFPQLSEDANAVQFVSEKFGAPADQAIGYASSNLYWGKQPFTNGPVYLGAVVCFLFIMGMFYLNNQHKWWIFGASVLGMLLALGNNLPGFNGFMFDYFPLYNKFRVPTMALIIPQMLFPIVAALFVNQLANEQSVINLKKIKLGAIATGAVFLLALGFYFSSDFSVENRDRTNRFNSIVTGGAANANEQIAALNATALPERDNQIYEGMVANMAKDPAATSSARDFVSAIRKDRAALFLGDIGRSFLFVLLAAAAIFLFIKKKINSTAMLVGISLILLIDLLTIDSKYLNSYNFDLKENYETQEFPITAADQQILNDKDPNFRVFDVSGGSPFESSKTSYYHKSIGGNHAAKLGIYDDLIANQLSGQPNLAVINMLNTKYIIQPQGNTTVAAQNPDALGNAWFVKGVIFVKGPVAEMNALTNFLPRDTAIVDESFKAAVTAYSPADSGATITQQSFDNDEIVYASNSGANHVAVFSEVYYKDWRAYIDGKEVPIFKANYVLRALVVPAGKHTISFKFEPALFFLSKNISTISSWLLFALMLFCAVVTVKNINKVNTGNNKQGEADIIV